MVRWGGYTVFLGRYIAFLRSYIGWLAGINRMAQGPFLLWNLAGATAWTLTFATLGYLVGNNWAHDRAIFKTLGYGGAVVVVAFVTYLVYQRRREARADAQAHAEVQEQADAEESDEQLTGPGASR